MSSIQVRAAFFSVVLDMVHASNKHGVVAVCRNGLKREIKSDEPIWRRRPSSSDAFKIYSYHFLLLILYVPTIFLNFLSLSLSLSTLSLLHTHTRTHSFSSNTNTHTLSLSLTRIYSQKIKHLRQGASARNTWRDKSVWQNGCRWGRENVRVCVRVSEREREREGRPNTGCQTSNTHSQVTSI
jgi:hypothetical protein